MPKALNLKTYRYKYKRNHTPTSSRFEQCPEQTFVIFYWSEKRLTKVQQRYRGYRSSGVWKPLCRVVADSPYKATALARDKHLRTGLYHRLRAMPLWDVQ